MLSRDRRLGFRVPFDVFLTQYSRDRPCRAMAANLSDTGIFVTTPKARAGAETRETTTVGLEIELPGHGETIWALGEVCHEAEDDFTRQAGIRFVEIPRHYARMIRDFCIEARHAHLGSLLARIRA